MKRSGKTMKCWKCQKKANKSTIEATLIDDDEASSDYGKRSPTPHSVAKTRTPTRRKAVKDKGKKVRDDDIKRAMEDIVIARK